MSYTKYTWTAFYEDYNNFLPQFVDGVENLFSSIDHSRLSEVVLMDSDKNLFGIDFVNGVICLNGCPIYFGVNDSNRLIYFRRVRQVVGGDKKVFHIFGFQSTIDGSNSKLLFALDDDSGRISFVER